MSDTKFDMDIFKDHQDYWQVAKNIKDIYLSEGSLLTLLDFERVLDSLDIYAFKNWDLGELVQGPTISKYKVSCIFMWPEYMMPDPRGAKRLLPFDCEVLFKKTNMKIPLKIEDPADYKPGTKVARIIEKKVWLVKITMPKNLMSDIRTSSAEMENDGVDLSDLDDAWSDKDQENNQSNQTAQPESDSPEAAIPEAPEQSMGM